MANSAGAAAIAVEYGAHPVQPLQACRPMYSARTVADLRQWLSENG
jgi:phosphoglycolate phosphatase